MGLGHVRYSMAEPTFVDLVARSLREDTRTEFERRVNNQGAALVDELRAGRLNNPEFGLGLELEVYAVDEQDQPARVPDEVFDGPCERELGVHNVEFNTTAGPFTSAGITAQADQLQRHYRHARETAAAAGIDLVLDAMWTIPPAVGSRAYLSTAREQHGITIAENMMSSPRYNAIDNDVLKQTGGSISLSVPGANCEFPSILFESLASSIQPHVQIPDVAAVPRHYNAALATLGPVLALATNSPLLPIDLYEIDDPWWLLEETFHELRIPVFEQSINAGWEKVRVPNRLRSPTDVVDKLINDPICAPFLREWLVDGTRETFTDQYWELDHKRGTYWRWLRSVVGGQPVGGGDQRSVRLEYRPLPTQPTIDDVIGFQCLVAGLVRGLVAADHPLHSLEHDAVKRNFYNAVEDGLEAELTWLTADGDRTTDSAVIYEELFTLARRGLREQDVTDETISRYLDPIETRWDQQTTPSRWKLERVRDALDAGAPFDEAVRDMQAAYVDRSTSETPFIEWG